MNRIYFERYGKPMKKRIYTVATSHLDTVWSWDFETTVSKYIYNTLVVRPLFLQDVWCHHYKEYIVYNHIQHIYMDKYQ